MATLQDKKNQLLGTAASAEIAKANTNLPPFPPLPDDIKARFPSLKAWEQSVSKWMQELAFNIRGGSGTGTGTGN